MKLPRRQFLHLAGSAAALPVASRIARAQTYPSRSVTMIVPFAAGGGSDVVGRIMAEQMRGTLGQRIIVEMWLEPPAALAQDVLPAPRPTVIRSAWGSGAPMS